jgi:molecular chaperone DnaK (HSP70)
MLVAVAIDFGTSRTGFAFGFFGDPKEDVHLRLNWPGQQLPYHKTLSDLLYGPGKRLEAWGASARLAISRLKHDPLRGQYQYVTSYKMQLQEGLPGPDGPEFEAGGIRFKTVELIADILAEIGKIVLADLSCVGTGAVEASEILWCLTVPACWTDANKQVMENAAIRAGLVADRDDADRRLLFALEPEAAALHCERQDGRTAGSLLVAGTKFMVVDAGGGTVDLTVHEKTDHGLREVVPGSAGKCGSTYLDGAFTKFLEEVLGVEFVVRLVNEESAEFLELLRHWEREKCQYTGGQNDQPVLIPISRRLGKMLDDQPDVSHRLRISQNGDDENIQISARKMAKIFETVFDDVRNTLTKQFATLKGERCDFLFLVGGFATSPALQNLIQSQFGPQVGRVVVPPQPGQAVLQGAVRFAMDQSRVASRRSRRTYGVQVRADYDPQLDNGRIQISDINGQVKCDGVFDVFVSAGELVETDRAVTKTYFPIKDDQKEMSVKILVTESTRVRHCDEPGVCVLGNLVVKMPNISGGRSRKVQVTMSFGQTRIRVRAIDETTNVPIETFIDFFFSRNRGA